jgi:hypothetical protein
VLLGVLGGGEDFDQLRAVVDEALEVGQAILVAISNTPPGR